MTIVLLQPDGVPITAQAERQGSAALYGGGSGRQLGGRSGFRVGTPADTLTATSTTWTLKPCAAMIDPGASTHQGVYGWASDSNVTGTVTASDATYARKDIVFIQVNDSTAGDGSGSVAALPGYLPGVPSATPSAPTLPARSFLVGTIDVPKTGAGSPTVTLNPARFVAAGAIQPVYSLAERDALTQYPSLTVRRMDITGHPLEETDGAAWGPGNGARHAEYTFNTPAASIPSATDWGPGTLTLDGSAVTTDSAVASSPAGNQIRLNKGTYAIWFRGAFGTPLNGSSYFQLLNPDNSVIATGACVEFWGGVSVPNFRVTADNTTLTLRFKWSFAGGPTNAAGRVGVTRIG